MALAQYRLVARRFALDFPGEPAPPDFTDLTRAYLADFPMLADRDKRADDF